MIIVALKVENYAWFANISALYVAQRGESKR